MAGDLEHQLLGEAVFRCDGGEDLLEAFSAVGATKGVDVVLRQGEVHLGQGHLHLADQHAEEGPALIEGAQGVEPLAVVAHLLADGGAHPKPAGK